VTIHQSTQHTRPMDWLSKAVSDLGKELSEFGEALREDTAAMMAPAPAPEPAAADPARGA
jgi:hypothetical protein